MIYKSTQVAKKIISLAKAEDKTLTPMQLLKLVYLAHAWMLALYNQPLIEEKIEAWKYGPVIPELYEIIKVYRDHPVTQIDCEEASLNHNSLAVLKEVYKKYGHLNGIQLSMITHEKGSPWDQTRKSRKTVISNDIITYYYQKLAANV